MSPRAAWRLETLGVEHVADYVGGKADWLGHGLPREGEAASIPYAGDIADCDPPTCGLTQTVGEVRSLLETSSYGFCVVVNQQRVVLGRLRRSSLDGASPAVTVESLMEPGPSTVRPNTPARELIERLTEKDLKTAILTTPSGQLLGVFSRARARNARGLL